MINPTRETTLRFLAEPSEVNFGGKVHGGAVMTWIDQAAYACAAAWSKQYCVTVYVGGIRFYQPIHIGNMVQVHAKVIYTGNRSMHIAVDVSACDPRIGEYTKTTHCIIIFVAVDSDGQLVAVPKWQPQTEEDQQLEQYALKLMELRQQIEDEMSPYRT